MGWSSNAPSGVTFSSTTKKADSKIWNYFAAYPMNVWVARGTGDTYYVKVTVNWAEGQNGSYQKDNDGVYWYVGSDKQNFAMPSAMSSQTKYYTGTRGSSGSVTVGVSPNSNLSSGVDVTSASIPAATYSVKYKGNGAGGGSTATQTKTYGDSLTLRANGFTRSGYVFTGWNTAADGSGTAYAERATYSANRALTLYAQWAVSYSLELSSSKVSTGGSQVITIVNGEKKTAAVTVKYSSTTLFSGGTTSGSITAEVTKAWFVTAGIVNASSFTATVTAVIGSTTLTKTFTVSAGADMFPQLSDVAITAYNEEPAATYFPGSYIAGVTKLSAAVSVAAEASATVSSVKLQLNGTSADMSYNSGTGKWEGVSSAAVTDGCSYTIKATDSRGLGMARTAAVTGVLAYAAPVATIDEGDTYRCKANGTQDITGSYYRAKAAATYQSNLTGNELLQFNVRLEGEQTGNALSSGVQSGVLGGSMSQGQSYTLVFTIQDKISAAREFYFVLKAPARAISIHYDSNGTEVDLPSGGKYMIGGVDLLDIIYPVGSIYMSVNGTSPQTLFGGTWAPIKDVFLLSAGDVYAAGGSGGEPTHTLDISEIPRHTHNIRRYSGSGSSTGNSLSVASKKYVDDDTYGAFSAGGGGAHNNMPPYLTVYVWKRTA